MKKLRILFTYGFLALHLTACTTAIRTQKPDKAPIQNREIRLKQLTSWQLNGKIAVQTRSNAGSATMTWVQRQNQFAISLMGPLGAQGLKLRGQPGEVLLETGDGKQIRASSAEELLAKQWGFHVPVSNLHYWVRGLPVPGIPANTQFDASHRMSTLTQAGWIVEYLDYTETHSLDLPSKIYITSPSLKTKIIIYQWKI